MSKRKTRQQKIIADLHRKLQSQSSLSSPAAKTTSLEKISPVASTYSYTNTPTYTSSKNISLAIDNRSIQHDLVKTSLVTAIIIAAQLLLFFLLKNHMITLPMVGY